MHVFGSFISYLVNSAKTVFLLSNLVEKLKYSCCLSVIL